MLQPEAPGHRDCELIRRDHTAVEQRLSDLLADLARRAGGLLDRLAVAEAERNDDVAEPSASLRKLFSRDRIRPLLRNVASDRPRLLLGNVARDRHLVLLGKFARDHPLLLLGKFARNRYRPLLCNPRRLTGSGVGQRRTWRAWHMRRIGRFREKPSAIWA